MTNFSSINAISPIDGRYNKLTSTLKKIFSEYGFLKFRIKVEVLWLKKLSQIPEISEVPFFDTNANLFLDGVINNFKETDAISIKFLEKKTRHDVKAIEYFLKNKIFDYFKSKKILEFIHFACTSDDINNLAYALMLKECRDTILLPRWDKIINKIKNMGFFYRDVSVLCRTHGQPATPSTVGKELINFFYRLNRQFKQLKTIEILGKINGTTGNYNAHYSAYPNLNWHKISEEFVTSIGLHWNPYTTQIEPHDYIVEFFNCIARFNTILIDFNRDVWGYISLEYFKQKIIKNEIGSSIMPHKVNPIDFENAEGNLGLSNSLIEYIASKLPISRWQRDLSDSTVLRNLGSIIGYSLVAYHSISLGLNKLEINKKKIYRDLNNCWSILAEPLQTVMRRYGITNSYETLKNLTRGKEVNSKTIHKFINGLSLPDNIKIYLKSLTPANYIGYSSKIIDFIE